MAIAAGTYFELNSGATAGNVNSGGFNRANANMLTDLTTDANTANTNSPIVSSASYNFAAGDVNHWLFIQAGTNWIPGWYQIASVASNKATLSATIGQGFLVPTNSNHFSMSTVTGCATVGTPTNGTFAIDYSQSTAAKINAVADFNAVGASTTLTSATAGFTPVMVGNLFHQTTTGTGGFGTVGWYEIVSYTNITTVVLDRAPNGGTASVNTTGYVGGALSMGALDDASIELGGAGSVFFVKGSLTYTPGAGINISAVGTVAAPATIWGYITNRATAATGSNRPIFAVAANVFTFASNWWHFNLSVTTTSATGFTLGPGNQAFNCKVVNSSTTAARNAFVGDNNNFVLGCEAVAYRGNGFNTGANTNLVLIGNYFHDCDAGFIANSTTASFRLINNIIESCVTQAIHNDAAATVNNLIMGNTLFGSLNKTGTGINLSTTGHTHTHIMNNIISGFVTGVDITDTTNDIWSNYNDYFNNTANGANISIMSGDVTLDPQFTNVGQVTGATATTTAGNHLVQAGATFVTSGVVAGRDYVYVISGTGVTAGVYGILSVDSETQITADITLAANATADKVFQITTGRDFSIGTNLKALGFPGALPASLTTGYMDIGAAQRQEAASGGMIQSRVFTGQ